MDCPRCHKEISDATVECPYCHIVVAQYLKRQREKAGKGEKSGVPASLAEEKKGPSLWLLVLLFAVLAGYYFVYSNRHKPEQKPAVEVAPAVQGAPETMARPAVPPPAAVETPEAPPEGAPPPQESQTNDESNDANTSAESFKKGEKRIKKLVHAASPMLPGDPERVLEDK